jgi:diguanylate cyclase (GGDEF)-like protein/PAS domain S-box-containing protein
LKAVRDKPNWASGWRSFSLGTKLNVSIQCVLIFALLIAHFWIVRDIEASFVEEAKKRASISADGVINGMNMLMVTGMISNPEHRKLFIRKMGASENVKELRVIRASQVQAQFGRGLPEEQVRDDMDRRAIETKQPQYEVDLSDEPTLRTVVPFIVSTNFRGTNCINCHHVEVGSVNGAASIVLDISSDYRSLQITRRMLWFGQIVVQLLLFLLTTWMIKKFTDPVVELKAAMETMTKSESMEGFLPIKLHNNRDEVGELADTFNRMAKTLGDSERSLRLAAQIYKLSPEAILLSDENNNIVDVNPAFTRQTGYTLEDVIGKNPRIFKSGRHDKKFYEEMWRAILKDGHWQGELCDVRKDGSLQVKFASISAIRHKDGTIFRHVAQFVDMTERKQKEEIIWHQANFDALTGLVNRRLFRNRLEQEIRKSARTGLGVALLLIDLDRFKEVNDTLGHDMGDLLLKEVALRLASTMRASDTVARLGGDEFSVLLPQIADANRIGEVAHKIINKLSEPFRLSGEVMFVSASIGITQYPNDGADGETLMKNADQAMYLSKRMGRNRYSFFTPSLQQIALERQQLIRDLREALAASQFQVFYQPIVELGTGSIHKAEALIRWSHPVRGMISPAQFIPLAEETGLILDIGSWVFREVVTQLKGWKELLHESFQISINRSPAQFQHHSIVNCFPCLDYLREAEVPARTIVFEITEGMLLDTRPGIKDSLQKFRGAGIQIALDDFGTGYSSLSFLKKFDIDYLKIDKSFIDQLATDSDDHALCEAIIAMAHKLGLKVIAEGIESEEQCRILVDAGCDYGQGYLFSRPVSAREFEKLLRPECLVQGRLYGSSEHYSTV